MADDRRIVIELTAGNASGASSGKQSDAASASAGESDLTDILKKIQHPIKALEEATLGKNLLVYRSFQQAMSAVKSTTTYAAGKYFNLTENYKAEQILSNTQSILSHVASAGSSIIGGAIAGSVVPGIGTIVGAVAGAISWTANTVIDSFKAYDRERMQLTAANMQSSFQMAKMGLIDDGRGTLN